MRWTPKVLAVAAGLMLGFRRPRRPVGKTEASLNIVHRPAYVCGDLLCSAREHLTVKATVPLSPGELPTSLVTGSQYECGGIIRSQTI